MSRVNTKVVHDLNVIGNVQLKEDLVVHGLVDGVRIAPDSVLLVSGDQVISGA